MKRNIQGSPSLRKVVVYNRLSSIMLHTTRYSIEGVVRLAQDAEVSHSSLSALMRGDTRPSWGLVLRITEALERELGKPLDPRDVVRFDPNYPTKTPCELVGCAGCLPPWFYGEDDDVRPAFRGVEPGAWQAPSTSH